MLFLDNIRQTMVALGVALFALSAVADEPRLVLRFASEIDRPDAVITAVAVSPDGRMVAAAGDDHGVRIWDSETGTVLYELDGHTDWVRAATFSADSKSLVTVSHDHSLRIWSLESDRTARVDTLVRLAEGALQAVAFYPNQERLATVGFKDPLRVYDMPACEETEQFACACEDTRTVAISPDGRWMAASGRNGRIRVWDLNTTGGSTDLEGDGRRVRALAFSPDGKTLAAAGDSPAVRLYRLEDDFGGLSQSHDELLIRPGKVFSLSFVTSRVLAVGGTDNKIQLWNTNSLSRQEMLTGHTGTVAALATSEQGNVLASGSYDATIRVWNLESGRDLATASNEPSATTR